MKVRKAKRRMSASIVNKRKRTTGLLATPACAGFTTPVLASLSAMNHLRMNLTSAQLAT